MQRLCWLQWRPKWRCVRHAMGLMSIHPVSSRLTWSTLVVPWRMECQPWLMNAKSSHLYSGYAVLFHDCACRKKHGFHECQHWHHRFTCVLGQVRYLGAYQLQHVLHHQSSVVRMQRWALPIANRLCEQQRLRAAWLDDNYYYDKRRISNNDSELLECQLMTFRFNFYCVNNRAECILFLKLWVLTYLLIYSDHTMNILNILFVIMTQNNFS